MSARVYPGAKTERNARIVALHVEEGLTFREIGDQEGLTPERVRQIVRRAGVPEWVTASVRSAATRKPRPKCVDCGERVRELKSRRCHRCNVKSTKVTDAELLAHLRSLAKRLGVTPGSRDLVAASPPGHVVYFQRFGSLRRAQELAGLRPNPVGGKSARMPYEPNGTGPREET